MYTTKEFGKGLKTKVSRRENIPEIGYWAYTVYFDHIETIDLKFKALLLTLNTMHDGPEFEYSYEELNKIADDLIAGREVKL